MSWRALVFASVVYASTAMAQQSLPLANEELLYSARVWEARERGDLAKLALEKLVAARPDSPSALIELGELHLRMAEISAAQNVLDRLQSRFPGSHAAKTFAIELRFATRDRLQLASVQRLIQIDRGAAARTELAKLFPQGAPDGVLAIEYFRLLASTPGGWEIAHNGLRDLVARHEGDPRYQLALARHLLRRNDSALEGVRLLTELAHREDVRIREVDDPLSSALEELGYRRAPTDAMRSYLERHPDDAEIKQLLGQRVRIEAEQEAMIREASTAADAEQQRRSVIELQDALLSMSIAQASADDAIAVLRSVRGNDEARAARFDEATRTTIQWARRSVASAQTNTARAAIEKDIAVAFARNNYEAVIPLVQRFEELSSPREAAALLSSASRLQPNSTWLFETRVRFAIDHGQIDEALQLLDARRVDDRWTVASRDELRANVLDQRAQAALAAGNTNAARQDLEAAIAAAPTYPWTRFRLAGLLAREGDRKRATELMNEGVARGPSNPEMRYAQALYLSSIDDTPGAIAALDAIPIAARTQTMQALNARLQIASARDAARQQFARGEMAAARGTLNTVQPLAEGDLELTRQLAMAWIDIDDAQRGLSLLEPFLQGERGSDKDVLLAWTDALNRADDPRLTSALNQLHSANTLSSEERQQVAALQREAELRSIRTLQKEGDLQGAIARVDAALAHSPNDRTLRILRAELDMSMGAPVAARDRYAALVGEQPEDLDTRLAYARALTESGDIELARTQIQTVGERAHATDVELRLSLARRQLDLGDSAGARQTLNALLATDPTRSDALMLAARAELADRDFVRARELFTQAERSNDLGVSSEARLAREAIETRLQSWVEGGIESRHKPGDSGISQFDALSVPTVWRYARDFEHRFTLRADAVSIDAGELSSDFDTAALLGTVQAAGSTRERSYRNEGEDGLALGLRYETDTLSADIGTTPLGFLLPNIVGGIEWAPEWHELDLAFGIERRAVTSSVLSYAGMRDPISGRKWGGVVETGPYVEAGLYREFYSVAGALRYTQLTGENVADNTFVGARLAADWKFWSRTQTRAFAGITLNAWSYEHSLQNYTFGHGGYYSPESYISIAFPLELQGTWRDWSYRLRASLSYSRSDIERAAFYPSDAALQAAAATSALPSGFDAPYYERTSGSGTSLSAYAAVEKQITPRFVIGAKVDIDRADYYEPTIFMLYVRHVFGRGTTQVAVPPRPVRAFTE